MPDLEPASGEVSAQYDGSTLQHVTDHLHDLLVAACEFLHGYDEIQQRRALWGVLRRARVPAAALDGVLDQSEISHGILLRLPRKSA
jgi:hypothetical protein